MLRLSLGPGDSTRPRASDDRGAPHGHGALAPNLRHVKHAGAEALDRLAPLLAELRTLPGLVEKRRGVFYRKSSAFVHFHEDESGLYADVRLADAFERRRVETSRERSALLAEIRSVLGHTARAR